MPQEPSVQQLIEQFRVPQAQTPPPPPAPPSSTPRLGEIINQFRLTPQFRVGPRPIAREEEQEPMSLFWKVVNELTRPQKALFAGIQAIEQGQSVSEAAATLWDEAVAGIGTGRFERDVRGADLLDPLDPQFANVQRGLESTGMSNVPLLGSFLGGQKEVVGFGLDIAADPLLLVPGRVFTAPLRGAAWAAGMGLSGLKEVPVAGRFVSSATEFLRNAFVTTKFAPGTAEGAATESTRYIGNLLEQHKGRLIGELRNNGRALGQLAREAGVKPAEMESIITNAATEIKLADEAAGVPEALENTFERIYTEYGVKGFDDFINSGGGRLIADEAPIRRAILHRKFAELEPELARQNVRITQEIEGRIFALKSNSLDRFIFERSERVIPTGEQLRTFEAIEKDYMYLATMPDFQDWASKAVYGDAQRWGFAHSPAHASDLHSQFQAIGARRVNQLAAEGKLAIKVEGGGSVRVPKGMQVFNEDPNLIDALRTYHTMKAVETSRVLDDLVKGYGLDLADKSALGLRRGEVAFKLRKNGSVELTKTGQQIIEDSGMVLLKGIKGFEATALPPEAAQIVQKTLDFAKDPSEWGKMLSGLDFVQNKLWKVWTLMPFSEYHFRNAVTNQILKSHAGMKITEIPSYGAKANLIVMAAEDPAITKRMRSLLDESPLSTRQIISGEHITVNHKEMSRLELLRLASGIGVTRGQWGATEIGVDFARQAKIATKEGASRIPNAVRGTMGLTVEGSSILRGGGKVAQMIEDTDRVSLWLWGMDQGMTPIQARDLVDKFLINYSDLTDFEKSLKKGFFPFYSWSRHAIPLMFETLVQDPTKFSSIAKAKKAIEDQARAGDGPEDRILPEYIREGVGVRYRQDEDGNYEYFVLNNWLPQTMLSEIDSFEELPKMVTDQLGPLWKAPVEMLFQRYVFYDREFTAGKKDFAGVRLQDWQIALLRNIRALSVIDRFKRENNPGMAANVLRALTGINLVKVDLDRANVAYQAQRRRKAQELQRAIQDANEGGHPEEAAVLMKQLEELLRR